MESVMYRLVATNEVEQKSQTTVSITSCRRTYPGGVKVARALYLLDVAETVGLPDNGSTHEHDYYRYDAEQGHQPPAETDAELVHPEAR
jgi:hypothetical protein